MTRFQGCGTALITPFTRAGAVDLAALERLVEWQIREGIDFLVPCGSTGEAQTLTEAERVQVVQTVVRVAAGQVPVMAGATDNDTSRAVAETKRMCAAGAAYILSATPYYNKPTQEGLYRHFMAVLDASSVPVCLYNVPGRTAVNIKPETVLRLASHPNCLGIKESSGDLQQVLHLLRGRPDHFAVLSGEDWMTFAITTAGGDGLISVVANEVPAAATELVRCGLNGKLVRGRELFNRLLPLIDANFIETNPGPVKAALALMGKCEDVVRLPLVAAGPATRDALTDALRLAGALDV
jgi:4-hydroxy-tetrahydrodipicolinate synthase